MRSDEQRQEQATKNVLETLTKEQILSIPGVMALVLEDCNNAILQEVGELEQEDLDAAEEAAEWDFGQEEV